MQDATNDTEGSGNPATTQRKIFSSTPPQTNEDEGVIQNSLQDQVMELIRRETSRQLGLAWEAERKLVKLCEEKK